MVSIVARISVPMLVAAVLLPLNAHADASAMLARKGEKVARMWCASCHVTGLPDQKRALVDAPTFASLAQRRDLTDGTIALALLRPHPPMPKQELSRDDVKAVTAYIRSLRTNASKTEESR